MKGLAPLFIGIFGTFAFSWVGLTVLPNWQIGHLNPQSEEEGEDHYPQPQSGMVARGAHVYAANGCIYCHSEQVRADYAAADIERKWGTRRSAPRDYIFERPVFLGQMRIGQDLANIGARAPAEQASPSPAGAVAPGASPAGATNPAASPSRPPAGVPAAASPAAKQTGSPAAQGQPGSPSPAASPGAASSAASAPSPPSSPPGASPGAAAVASSGSPPPGPPSGLASPSPRTMGTTAISSGAQPGTTTASSSGPQIAGAPWPLQTVGEPPMYSAEWHHVHLYSPRSTNLDSIMPAYRFLYEKRRITGERSAEALRLTGRDAPEEGWEVVPNFDAKCLVAYLMSRNQTHPLKDVRSVGGAPAAAAGAAPAGASPSPAAAAAPAPGK